MPRKPAGSALFRRWRPPKCRRLSGIPCRACVGILSSLVWSASAHAQTSTPTDSDPTRPIFVSVRPEFYRIRDEAWRMLLIGRYDTARMRDRWFGGKRGMLIRVELPVATGDTPATPARSGFGDTYGQVLLVPFSAGRFALVAGSGLFVPTA